jgi:pimeloyl-ACP methyl ester carboxylesterase
MAAAWQSWLSRLRPRNYGRKQSLILVNGLAEQAESWFRNVRFWRRYFEVHSPNILAYDGDHLHARIDQGLPISVDYLVEQLHDYLTRFVQSAPYHLVASSLGGKVVVEFAARYPKLVGRVVLLCPSGMGDVEQLPIIEGVRRNDMKGIVTSIFHKPRKADRDMLRYYLRQFPNRRWRAGLLRTVRGTMDTTVRGTMKHVQAPTLLVSGSHDRIVDPKEAQAAARDLPHGQFLLIPNCGHAPQIEKAWLINRLVVHFLTHAQPTSHPRLTQLLLNKPSKVT